MHRNRMGTVLARTWRLAGTVALAAALLLVAVGAPAVRAAVTSLPAAPSTGALSASEWSQIQLLAAGGLSGDFFGGSVAISGDTLVVGAVGRDSHTGAAYVFVRNGQGWTQQAMLTASDGATSDFFGDAVAISGDTVIVGAPDHDSNHTADPNSNEGAAYVFVRSGTTWAQQGATFTGATAGDVFGHSVAISGDAVVVGAPGHGSYAGAAYVFARNGTVWAQQATLTAANGATGDQFGASVTISGGTVVVGAPSHESDHATDPTSDEGAAYVFVPSFPAWTQQGGEFRGTTAGSAFGSSVAISGDTTVVGAEGYYSCVGAAYVLARSGTAWTQQGSALTATNGASYDWFGCSVAIAGDTVVVGALGAHASAGAAYVFTPGGTNWSEQAELTATGGATGDTLGYSVAVYGGTVVVGAPGRDNSTGAVYVFERSVAHGVCGRADVSAVIYGAPEGTPVKAYVGGGEQPTLYTAHDALNRQAVLWTFFPPDGADWTVAVEPQLPSGYESPRWQYELVGAGPAPSGSSAGGAVTISNCSAAQLQFRLVDTGIQ